MDGLFKFLDENTGSLVCKKKLVIQDIIFLSKGNSYTITYLDGKEYEIILHSLFDFYSIRITSQGLYYFFGYRQANKWLKEICAKRI